MTYYMVETKNTHIPMWFDFMQGTWVANCLATKFADRESAERMAATLHPRDYIITEHMSGDVMELPSEKDWPIWAKGIVTIFTEKSREPFTDYLNGTSHKAFISYFSCKPSWVPKDNELVVGWNDGDYPTAIVGMAYLYNSHVVGKHDHYAKVGDISDIGRSIDWFKANRPWK